MVNAPPQRPGYPRAGDPSVGMWQPDDGWDAPTHSVASARGPAPRPLGVAALPAGPERGVPGWLAVVVLIAISGIGGIIDIVRGTSVRGGFNIALIVASVVAIIIVRRRSMFPVLVAPPLVYFVASAVMLYVRSSGLSDRGQLLDAAINWLVYGFPAIAGATAAVLIIGGIRLLAGR